MSAHLATGPLSASASHGNIRPAFTRVAVRWVLRELPNPKNGEVLIAALQKIMRILHKARYAHNVWVLVDPAKRTSPVGETENE